MREQRKRRLAYATEPLLASRPPKSPNDPLLSNVSQYLDNRPWVRIPALATALITPTPTKRDYMRLGSILRFLGWQRHAWRGPEGHTQYWLPPGVNKKTHISKCMLHHEKGNNSYVNQ
jgi:hypothetical protein